MIILLQTYPIPLILDGARMEFPPLVTKDMISNLMAQMTVAAASAAASSTGLPPNLIPSSAENTDFVQQALWMSRAQKLFEDEQQRNSLFKEICLTKDSSELAMALLHQGKTISLKYYAISHFQAST